MSALARLRDAFARGAAWRYLALFAVLTWLPTTLAVAPLHGFLAELLDHSPRAASLVKALDAATLVEIVRQLGEPVAGGVSAGFGGALFVALLFGPALAGAAATVAARTERADFPTLLASAGRLYGRMLRMVFVGAIPFGIAGGLGAALLHAADSSGKHAVLASSASRASTLAWTATVLLVWLAHTTLEVGRAVLATDESRRSALKAWGAGLRLSVRRPLAVLGASAVTTLAGLLLAAVVTAVRLRLHPGGPGGILVSFVLAQLAVAVVGLARAARLGALVNVVRGDG